MIDFTEEISKYKPILGVEDISTAIETDEIKDMMDILQYIVDQISEGKKE